MVFFVLGTTEDGLSSAPVLVSMTCRHDNVSNMNYVDVHWEKPHRPGGQIEFYNVRKIIELVNQGKMALLNLELFCVDNFNRAGQLFRQ